MKRSETNGDFFSLLPLKKKYWLNVTMSARNINLKWSDKLL